MPPRPDPARTESRANEWHPAVEEYCETIYELSEDAVDVIQARIADRLGVSRPSVSEMIHRMAGDGLVTLSDTIRLTRKGQAIAEQVVRRHRLAERLLTDVLGLSWADAHHEAGKWEHVISPPVEAALVRVLGAPTTCPHGNPIPGTLQAPDETVPLADIEVGQQFTVVRIREELEFTPGLLTFLEDAAIVPGHVGVVTASAPDGTSTVEIVGHHAGVSAFASERILVNAGS